MKKILFTLLLVSLFLPSINLSSDAALVSNRTYRAEQKKEIKQDIKLIKELFATHELAANKHDVKALEHFYADNYMNNDGFDKKSYFKSIESTWKACDDLTYNTKILSINVNGDHASVYVDEIASGTITETIDSIPISGEIHSKSKGIYQLIKINGVWYISGETSLSDESSLLYGEARFTNIELQAPEQVGAGETYTVSLKVDATPNTFIVGSIDHDPVTFPSKTPQSELRALPKSQFLERLIKANSDNINEYAIASLAISKVNNVGGDNFRVYMAGLACVMKRVNVVPKNNFINLED